MNLCRTIGKLDRLEGGRAASFEVRKDLSCSTNTNRSKEPASFRRFTNLGGTVVRIGRNVFGFAMAVFAVVAASAPAGPGMFRGGPEHTGVYASANPTLGSVAWRFRTGGEIVSSPLLVGTTVYVGSRDRFLYALDATTGALRWKFETGGAVSSSPAYRDGVVYVGSVDGMMYAINASTGKPAWLFKTTGESRFTARGIHGASPAKELMPDPFDVFLSSPTIVGDALFFGSGDHNVYALDATTGELRWKFITGNVVHASPAVAGGVVYVGSWDRNMYALDAASGKERWRFQTGNDTTIYNQIGIASSAAVSAGVVYFGCRDGHFYAVDASTGRLRWSVDNHSGWVIASPAVKDGTVYFPTSDGQRFKALDAATGAVRFDVETKAISFSSPAIVNQTLYFGTSDGWLHAMDAATGATTAEFQSDGSKENAAKYIDKAGHIRSDALYPDFTHDGMVVGLHRMFTLGSMLSSPVVANGILYIGSTDGNVYALK
jgi:outer membrane protein assembly factor BamB